MKLIEILVRDLHKFGGWPAGAVECQHFVDEANIDFYDANGNWGEDCFLKYGAFAQEAVRERTQPCQVVSVTREQYEAALAASKEMLINKHQPVWNGEGLPPVGCECEWQEKNTKEWSKIIVVFASECVTVIRENKAVDPVDIAIENYGDEARRQFRPIRTEAELKRVDTETALRTCLAGSGAGITPLAATKIYDAIAAGKIRGVKLSD